MKHLTFFILFLFVYCPATAQVAVLDGTDDPLGIYLESFTLGSELEGPNIGQRYRYHLITNEGYRYLLTGTLGDGGAVDWYWWDGPDPTTYIWFDSTDCSGQAFMQAGYSGFISKEADFQGRLWYSAKGSQIHQRTMNSRLTDSQFEEDGCRTTPDPVPLTNVVEVNLHDSAVTGLGETSPEPPIRLETSLSQQFRGCLFKDGFECSQ